MLFIGFSYIGALAKFAGSNTIAGKFKLIVDLIRMLKVAQGVLTKANCRAQDVLVIIMIVLSAAFAGLMTTMSNPLLAFALSTLTTQSIAFGIRKLESIAC